MKEQEETLQQQTFKEQMKAKCKKSFWEFENGDWLYREKEDRKKEGLVHLFRGELELTKDIETKYCFSYPNGDWEYNDWKGFVHLIRDGVELTKGIKARSCWSYVNNDWKYEDEQGYWHLFRDGIELTKDIKAIHCWSYKNGNWSYINEKGNLYKLRG